MNTRYKFICFWRARRLTVAAHTADEAREVARAAFARASGCIYVRGVTVLNAGLAPV